MTSTIISPEAKAGRKVEEFSVGSVRLIPFTATSRAGRRVWGFKAVENGYEFNSAITRSGTWFKNDTKAKMIEDLEQMYTASAKYGDPIENETRWRKNFMLLPLAQQRTPESEQLESAA